MSNTRTESVLLFGHIVFHALQATVLALVVLLVMFFWPAAVPFAFFQFWRFSGNLPHVLLQCWPLFAWGVGVTSIIAFFHTNDWEENHEAEGMFLLRAAQSLSAGFFEEVCYRWLLFLALIPFFKVANVAVYVFIVPAVAVTFFLTKYVNGLFRPSTEYTVTSRSNSFEKSITSRVLNCVLNCGDDSIIPESIFNKYVESNAYALVTSNAGQI